MDNNSDDVIDLEHDSFPDEMLEILGTNPEKEAANAFILHDELSSRWRHIILEGTAKTNLSLLLNKFSLPSNLSDLVSPKLNTEFNALLDNCSLTRDESYVEIQNHISKGL